MSTRHHRRGGALLAAVLLLVALTGCEATIQTRINDARTAAGRPTLPRARYLDEAAKAKSRAMCDARTVTTSPDPTATYDGEQALWVVEASGAQPLDMSIADPWERDAAATDALWAEADSNPNMRAATLLAQWDDMGVGQTTCPDGKLYMTTLLRDRPSFPAATGRFTSPIYSESQVTVTKGLVYGRARHISGAMVDLALDVYAPPRDGTKLRPAVVLAHGGAFVGGNREIMAADAMGYARLGYVGITISYRLRPEPRVLEEAVADAIDDGMESVRWVRANAGTYAVDTSRIAFAGTSAGGAIALGVGMGNDLSPTGPLAAYSPAVATAVSTGAHLTPGLDLPVWSPDRTPVLMYTHEIELTEPDAPADHDYETCLYIRDGGGQCDWHEIPGEGHTIGIGPSGSRWAGTTGPYLWDTLRLASL